MAQPNDQVDYGVSWQELTRTVGASVGKEQADKVVADVEAQFAAAKAANPEFAGATGADGDHVPGLLRVRPAGPARPAAHRPGLHAAATGLDEVTGKEFGANISRSAPTCSTPTRWSG